MMIALTLTLATLMTTPDPLIDQAVQLALNASCGYNTECRDKRADQAKDAARSILEACGEHMPRRHCLTLVATLAESKMNAYPTCSPQRCRDLCGLEVGGGSRRCRVRCARAISPRARIRAKSCNDGGSSAGWFQMKTVLTNACAKAMGVDVDPHDLEQAAACYAWTVAKSHKANRCAVQASGQRWGVSFARVAGGPYKQALVEGRVLRLPRCTLHAYARRARNPGKIIPRAVRLPVKTAAAP